ncbi:Leishmanolysin-like peptidase [Echinococcus granulosus]|uniref:Leishmanolysin-like peptidase n=1 Tax=Echinococcus granulosus TaxID=6210 RepID=W6VAK8_ECHGR|nr:Leishmanolysin-like peptidase [Echinococcus granulosus]EUB63819.1 Leishmanolysin-like peptidase [Echinococcus granulosus]
MPILLGCGSFQSPSYVVKVDVGGWPSMGAYFHSGFYFVTHWLCVIYCLGGINCFPCNHLGLKADDVVQNVAVLRTARFKRSAEHSRLSFSVYMDPSFTGLPNDSEIRSLIVDPALKFFEKALYLRSPPVTLANLDRSCKKGINGSSQLAKGTNSFCALDCEEVTHCGPVSIPPEHLNGRKLSSDIYDHNEMESPVNTGSFLLYLAAKRTKKCTKAGILGYSSHCQREMNTDSLGMSLSVSLHRAFEPIAAPPSTHLCLFSQRFAREYFSCPHLEGVELENQGGVGVSLSHWEMRILGNELMTATYTNVFRLSNLTLAFLEDTGWYLPNYSLAEHLAWGAKRGCVFSTASCYSYMLDQLAREADIAPFCLTPQDKPLGDLFVCTPGRRSFGYCNLIQMARKSNATDSHPMYTYFGNTSRLKYQGRAIPHDYFGKVDLADFCPFVQTRMERLHARVTVVTLAVQKASAFSSCCINDRSEVPLESLVQLDLALTNLNNYNLEVYGPNSICLSIAPNWILLGKKSTAYEAPVRGAGCYKYRCSHKEGGLIVELAGGLQILCPAGVPTTLVNISVCLRESGLTVLGHFHCPECTSYCSTAVCFSRNSSKSPVVRPYLKNGTMLSQSPVFLQPCRGNTLASMFEAIIFVLTFNSIKFCF